VSLDEVVRAHGLAAGGRAVARLADGRTVFLNRAFPGDLVRLRRGRVHRTFVEVDELELLEAGPPRQRPPCPDEERCGGCDWMGLSLADQRAHKAAILRQSLERVGGIAPERLPAELPVVAGAGLAYRRRVRLQLVGRRLGFFAGDSRTLVDVQHCHVCAPELWAAVVELRAVLADEQQVPAELLRGIVGVELRVLEGAARPALRLVLAKGVPVPRQLLRRLSSFAFVDDDPALAERFELCPGVYVLLPPGGFVQVNPEVNRHLLAEVLERARACGAKTALDVYSGIGNFALPLASMGIETLGLELSRQAVTYAERAAGQQALSATFRAGPADSLLAALAQRGERFDLVVLDPPRAGAKGLAPLLAQVCQRLLLMISCDPVTLARDARQLEEAGFCLERTTVFDMFPQTHHIESLTTFRRKAAD